MASQQQLSPQWESDRIKVLRRYEILDTPPDGAFERITSIAARLFKVPIAIVSLVDTDRIWFKSRYGLDVEQIERSPGLCASAILSNDVYAIVDASKDVRSLTNPLVVGEMGLRFYAAAPLTTHDGYNLGTLCVIDKQPHSISEEEKSILTDLAGIVMDEIELRLAARNVAQLNMELAQAKEAAEVANKAKSLFIANMSHELRSPLNAILGFSRLIQRSQSLSLENLENASIIIRSGEHLLSLINQVLDFSKLESGRTTLNAKNFDLFSLLDELEDMFQQRSSEKGLELLCTCTNDVPRYIRTDEVKLRQALINLISNGIKFTNQGRVLVKVGLEVGDWRLGTGKELTSSPTATSQSRITFEIEDTGVGIADEEFDQLFEAFVQTTTGKESLEGTGLGLAITRKFVHLLGGEINVSSQVGVGTTFKFDIPVTVVDAKDIESKQPSRTAVSFSDRRQFSMEYRFLRADGEYRWICNTGIPRFTSLGNFNGYIGSCVDITEHKIAETTLRQALETAELANKSKTQFLASMTHELRTPLNVILGFTQVMCRNDDISSEHQEYLSLIMRSGEHLLELIDDILEMSKIEAGRITLNKSSFDLYRLLHNLQEMFQLKAQSKELQLIFERAEDVPQYVQTDEGKLRQVLINLLSNAVKFTEAGSNTTRLSHSFLPCAPCNPCTPCLS